MTVRDAPVLCVEIAVLQAKDVIAPVPPAEMKQGFYSSYFIVPKESGGLWPILDRHVFSRALHKLPFRMLMQKHILSCIQSQDWFAAVNLKDAYLMSKGATCKGQAALGSWTGPRQLWHINYHELLAVFLALRQFRPLLQDKHVLICTDNTMAVLYNSPVISSSEVRHGSSRCVPSTFWGSSIVQPTHSHDSSCSPENGNSIIRWSS